MCKESNGDVFRNVFTSFRNSGTCLKIWTMLLRKHMFLSSPPFLSKRAGSCWRAMTYDYRNTVVIVSLSLYQQRGQCQCEKRGNTIFFVLFFIFIFFVFWLFVNANTLVWEMRWRTNERKREWTKIWTKNAGKNFFLRDVLSLFNAIERVVENKRNSGWKE